MTGVAIDASALIAFLHREPGSEIVAKHLRGAMISAVNLSEVMEYVPHQSEHAEKLFALLRGWQVKVVPFDEVQAAATAAIKAELGEINISFAGRACLALARKHALKVVTADQDWKSLPIKIKVIVIRAIE